MFASLVDGNTVNGTEIPSIGLTKAYYIYSYALLGFQDPYTGKKIKEI